jgi:uncharacterized NAD-dependent epimerase/dehydratase family protein
MSKLRFLILADENFGPMSSKTANGCIRYTHDQVVAVLDRTQAGKTAQQVLGFGGDIPVVATFEEGLSKQPNAILIGIAPSGGQLPPHWRQWIREALEKGLPIWNGLHTFIGDDPEFAELSLKHGTEIRDVRKAPPDLPVANGRVLNIDATVILTVGSDCNIGKMTASLQLRDSLRERGRRVAFAGTGQTGIFIEGWGIGVDAVVADFIAGAAERLTLEAAKSADIVMVEGQGSLLHPGYSGVTLGLIHGSLPHAFVLCHQPTRTTIDKNPWVKVPSLTDLVRLHEAIVAHLRPAPVIAIALNTHDLEEAAALDAISSAAKETGLPVTDPVRFDPSPLSDAVDNFHNARVGLLAAR